MSKNYFLIISICFGKPSRIPVTEEEEKTPISSYGETKLIGERLLKWYYNAYGIKSISLRYFNAAGAYKNIGEDRKFETHILPLIFKSIRKIKPLIFLAMIIIQVMVPVLEIIFM